MRIHTVKIDSPDQNTPPDLKARGYRWEAGTKVWWKLGDDFPEGVECHVIPRLVLSAIRNTSDPAEIAAKDARLKAEWAQRIRAIREAVGDGEVWSFLAGETFLVSACPFPGAVRQRNLDRLVR